MKSMRVSVERSLKKLQTDYIDLLYVHWWDFTSSVEEVMHGLNNLVNSGKVLYLGVSDTPAWVVVKANDYARVHGLRPFSVYQGKWNAGFRDLEREIIPMCRDQGMAIAPWAPLGQGKFKSSEARSSDSEGGSGRASNVSEHDIQVSDALEKVAKRKNTTLHAVVSFHPIPLFSMSDSDYRLTAYIQRIGSSVCDAEDAFRFPHCRSTES